MLYHSNIDAAVSGTASGEKKKKKKKKKEKKKKKNYQNPQQSQL